MGIQVQHPEMKARLLALAPKHIRPDCYLLRKRSLNLWAFELMTKGKSADIVTLSLGVHELMDLEQDLQNAGIPRAEVA